MLSVVGRCCAMAAAGVFLGACAGNADFVATVDQVPTEVSGPGPRSIEFSLRSTEGEPFARSSIVRVSLEPSAIHCGDVAPSEIPIGEKVKLKRPSESYKLSMPPRTPAESLSCVDPHK